MIQLPTMIKINEKHTRAVNKYDWSGYSTADMKQALFGELIELYDAYFENKIHGPHGVIDEAYDAIAVLLRIIETLEGEKNASNQNPTV
jgi:hypothetical protein